MGDEVADCGSSSRGGSGKGGGPIVGRPSRRYLAEVDVSHEAQSERGDPADRRSLVRD